MTEDILVKITARISWLVVAFLSGIAIEHYYPALTAWLF